MKDILENMKRCEKITETRESSEEADISEDVSELKEKIRGLGTINKMLLKKLLCGLGLDKGQPAKTLEVTAGTWNSQDTARGLARDLGNHSEEERAVHETQLRQGEAGFGFPQAQEGSVALREDMEQLLQEAERWSAQQAELSELLRLCQASRDGGGAALQSHRVCFQSQAHGPGWASGELEAQVRRLNHDTHSLHLVAALLESQCHIVQQRVALLRDLQAREDAAVPGQGARARCPQHAPRQPLPGAGRAPRCKQSVPSGEGALQNRGKFCKCLDSCRSKKARNNRFNARLARALWRETRPACSLK